MKRNPGILSITIAIILLISISANLSAITSVACYPGGEVLRAYNLRMSGKVDQAKELLESILRKDSTNAMAYYELARLQQYMLIGGAKVKMGDIVHSAEKAVMLDPENVTYAYYKSISYFMDAFMSMQTDQGQVKEKIEGTAKAFEQVLELKPDYPEAMMYLVEIYGMLPSNMGGDSLKAISYAGKLERMNKYYGGRARAALLPEGSDLVKFWTEQLAKNKESREYQVELGKAYLMKGEPDKAQQCFSRVIRTDPSKNTLTLDLARYHLMNVMGNKELAPKELPLAKKLIQEYLESKPGPVIPLKTYAIGLQARAEMFLGNQSQGDKLMAEAKALDPYFSKASGLPTLLLFDAPDQVIHQYFSFFSPY